MFLCVILEKEESQLQKLHIHTWRKLGSEGKSEKRETLCFRHIEFSYNCKGAQSSSAVVYGLKQEMLAKTEKS